MKREIISTENAPAAIGPYSQCVKIDNLIYTSGQIPVDPKTGQIPESIEDQAKQSLANVKAVIEAAGGKMSSAVKLLIFIKDMNDFAKINEVYATFWEGSYPARSCVEVARLPKDVLIEIEAIALAL
ncbi:MAG: RidA family protein [bacterium]|nr:RidA family protein [bacterium]